MITSKDIHEKKFSTKINGYSGAQVDFFLDQVAAGLDALVLENETLKAELKKARDELGELRAIETALRDAMVTAQKSAAELMADSRAQAQQLIAGAQAQAADLLAAAQDDLAKTIDAKEQIKAQIKQYSALIRQVMDGQLDIMEQHFSTVSGQDEPEPDDR